MEPAARARNDTVLTETKCAAGSLTWRPDRSMSTAYAVVSTRAARCSASARVRLSGNMLAILSRRIAADPEVLPMG